MSLTRSRPPVDRPPPAVRPLLAMVTLAPLLRLAVVRHAVPSGAPRRSGCDACGAPVQPGRPWPALSPVARCAGCGGRVGPPPGVVEVALVAAAGLLAALHRSPVELLAVAWWLAWVIPLALVDLAVHRLPDRLTWPAAGGAWGLLGLAALTGGGADPWLRATLAGVGLAALFAATTLLLGRRGFGLGDAKLALGVGMLLGWTGWDVLTLGMLLTFGLSALVGLLLLATRRVRWSSHLPFGPFLVLGTALTLALTG